MKDDLQLGKLKENCLLLKLYRKLRKMFLSPRRESNPSGASLIIAIVPQDPESQDATFFKVWSVYQKLLKNTCPFFSKCIIPFLHQHGKFPRHVWPSWFASYKGYEHATYTGIRKQKSEVKTAEGLTYQGGEGWQRWDQFKYTTPLCQWGRMSMNDQLHHSSIRLHWRRGIVYLNWSRQFYEVTTYKTHRFIVSDPTFTEVTELFRLGFPIFCPENR